MTTELSPSNTITRVSSANDEAFLPVFRLGHRPPLDGLRGICVLLVVLHHMSFPLAQGGFLGVDGFFVLSGFLITTILVQEWSVKGEISLRRFYMRRILRLFPALLVLLVFIAILTLFAPDGPDAAANWRGIFSSLIYAGNWNRYINDGTDLSLSMGLLDHTWSLAVEEHFYILWPLLLGLMLARRLTRSRILAIVMALATLVWLWRIALALDGASPERLYAGSDTRFDGILTGCILALALSMQTPRVAYLIEKLNKLAPLLLIVSTPLLVWVFFNSATPKVQPMYVYFGVTVVSVAVVLLILYVVSTPQGSVAQLLSWRPLVGLGTISYGLYLWHYPVFTVLRLKDDNWADWTTQVIRVVASLSIALLSYRYVELPMLRLKHKYSVV